MSAADETVTTTRISRAPDPWFWGSFAVVLSGLLLMGCGDNQTRAQAIADSAATSWEAADALDRGVPPAAGPTRAIKENSAAIIGATGRIYPPAGVTAAASAP